MRRWVTLVVVLALLVALGAAPVTAGKRKKGSFSAESPVPGIDGCPRDAQEGLSKTSQELKVPFSGTLTVTMTDFLGDWDLHIIDADGQEIAYSNGSQLTGTAPVEEVSLGLVRGTSVKMVACNWVGGPWAEVAWTLVGK
ncbi:MAG TPA: hypothetical protein VG408_01570, partial [Actinomycetota bacterium]|nr:hypothetical protein [Actinomycetota bacterium]